MKLVLLFNLLIGGVSASVISSDRFLIKILDRNISEQDLQFQLRNFKALNCIYNDAFVIQYFEKSFINDLEDFLKKFPAVEDLIRPYLHNNEKILKKIRHLFKMLRYSEDQKTKVSKDLGQLIRQSTKENNCNAEVLYKETLKTNFIDLMEMELYLRARYGSQLKNNQEFDAIRPTIDLFVESLDKQFGHEYFW